MSERVTRREFAGAFAAGAGAALMAASAGAQDEKKSDAPIQDNDIRVRIIEESRGKDFTPEQRKAVLGNIRNTDKQWAEGRKFDVPDNTEPAFVFTPTPLSRGRSKR
jgi:hypothetical protein